ncbi:hypothetical protein SDC9_93987 [bioreactor metagenome]|uniref:Helix-turn-helix domain-containing protein n=1 Tax=bioreactor metagenome TaxID=1076179 RepID=A0A645A248_9ZZZZ|nr:helix-turn-helix domain-containing protein [Paludibacter sp.]
MVSKLIIIREQELEEMFRNQLNDLKILIESNQSKVTNWISSEDVPNYLGVSRKTWQNYRDKKLIVFSQIGRKIWVKRSDLDAFIESGMIGKHGQTSKI